MNAFLRQEAGEESQGSFPVGSGLQVLTMHVGVQVSCIPPAKGELPCHSHALHALTRSCEGVVLLLLQYSVVCRW